MSREKQLANLKAKKDAQKILICLNGFNTEPVFCVVATSKACSAVVAAIAVEKQDVTRYDATAKALLSLISKKIKQFKTILSRRISCLCGCFSSMVFFFRLGHRINK